MPYSFEVCHGTEANMSSLQGYINIRKDILVELFGEPENYCGEEPDEYLKVRNEWVLNITDNNGDSGIVTIYDWKNYHLRGDLPDDFENWHVGGHSYKAPEELRQLLLELSGQLYSATNDLRMLG